MTTHEEIRQPNDRHPRIAYRVREVVERLGVCERTVRTWIAHGKLRAIRKGRVCLVPREALEEFMSEDDG